MLSGAAYAAPDCMSCHSMNSLTKTFNEGDNISLYVDNDTFLKSIHGNLGCNVCHMDITSSPHPSGKSYTNLRDFKVQKSNACKMCHNKIWISYNQSVHGKLNSEHGNKAAVCGDCHGAHNAINAKQYNKITNTCKTCHKDVLKQHNEWLPNTNIHLSIVSCPACHTPGAERRLNIVEDDLALSKIRTGNVEDAHIILNKNNAIRNCDVCHKSEIPITLNDEAVNKTINDVDVSGGEIVVDNIRNSLLNWLFVLALVMGISVPIGHILLSKIIKRLYKE